jgi:3-deoxy-D-manno-octulosonic-acid transferase
MPLLYDLVTGLYHTGIRCASPFNGKAGRAISGRRGLWKRLKEKAPELQGCIWMHCSSVGEFEQGRPVLEALQQQFPDRKFVLTFFSPSGLELFRDSRLADHIDYLPFDSAATADRFLALLRPSAAIFVKYEFWFHYLDRLKRRKVPTFLISAVFRPDQVFFRWYGALNRNMLRCFDRILVQNEASAALLKRIRGIQVEVCGDTRFDRVHSIVERNEELPLLREFRQRMDGPVLMAGSTWKADEDLLLPAVQELKEMPALVVAPHELKEAQLHALAAQLPAPVSRWSAGRLEEGSRTLLIDSIGQLSRAYRYADVAYVGGGFSDGIHNLLEPAAWGVPVVFGPQHGKFTEAKALIDAGAGFEVRDRAALRDIMDRLLNDRSFRSAAGEAAAAYVQRNAGATQRTVKAILHRLKG